MSLTVSSTTDDQAAVNAAAGIETEETPAEQPQEETAERPVKVPPEPEPDEDEEEEAPPEEAPRPKKQGGFQRKIERLARENEELRYALYQRAPQQPEAPAAKQQPSNEPPRPDQYQDYDQYQEALIDYRVNQQLEQRERMYQQQRAVQEIQQAQNAWQERVGAFKTEAKDFDEVLADVDHIEIKPFFQKALLEDEMGPKLAYELARNPETFEKLARIASPLAAIKALGEFKGSLNGKTTPPRKPVSQAPPPIRPVGQGASGTSTVPLDQLDYQAYKRARAKQIAARRAS